MEVISVDGIDCAGKSTYCVKLFNEFIQKGIRPKIIHFPRYNTKIGKLAWEELHSSSASVDRVQMLCMEDFSMFQAELSRPGAYSDFDVIIMDRSIVSTLAYNEGFKRNKFIAHLINKGRVTIPNKSILLIPTSMDIIDIRLRGKKNKDSFEKLDYLTFINERFKSIAKTYNKTFNLIIEKVE